jgi:hypothetical protein
MIIVILLNAESADTMSGASALLAAVLLRVAFQLAVAAPRILRLSVFGEVSTRYPLILRGSKTDNFALLQNHIIRLAEKSKSRRILPVIVQQLLRPPLKLSLQMLIWCGVLPLKGIECRYPRTLEEGRRRGLRSMRFPHCA